MQHTTLHYNTIRCEGREYQYSSSCMVTVLSSSSSSSSSFLYHHHHHPHHSCSSVFVSLPLDSFLLLFLVPSFVLLLGRMCVHLPIHHLCRFLGVVILYEPSSLLQCHILLLFPCRKYILLC